MTQQDFANSVAAIKGFLTKSEIADVFLKMSLFDSSEVECPFSSKLRCKKSRYNVQLDSMKVLCETELLIDSATGDKESVESLLLKMKDMQNGDYLYISSLRILVQCCSDLANTVGFNCDATDENKKIREEISEEFKKWKDSWKEEISSKNVAENTQHITAIKEKLNELITW